MPATKSKPALSVSEWLKERLEICERIAETKTGVVRSGWLEDAGYFRAAIESRNALVEALEQIAGKNDLSGVSAEAIESAARNALYECELIARAALAAAGQS